MTVVYEGEYLRVEQELRVLPNGRQILAEWVVRTDGVRIVARQDNGDVLIADEWRPELGSRDFRLPGGKVEGSSPLDAAKRELLEETGYRATTWRHLGSTQALSMIRYSLHYFEATGLIFDPIEHDEGEDITTCWFPLEQAAAMALAGTIGEDLSALQILRLSAQENSS